MPKLDFLFYFFKSSKKLYDVPPDGEYGWFIVGGHFINIGIGYAFTKSFGVFFPYIRQTFNETNTTTSLIFSVMMFTQYCGALVGKVSTRNIFGISAEIFSDICAYITTFWEAFIFLSFLICWIFCMLIIFKIYFLPICDRAL